MKKHSGRRSLAANRGLFGPLPRPAGRILRGIFLLGVAIGSLGGCRALLGIEDDEGAAPGASTPEADGGGTEAGNSPQTGADSGPTSTDGGGGEDGKSGPADRRFALWVVPPVGPSVASYTIGPDVVVDAATGLAWERKPAITAFGSWAQMKAYCEGLAYEGRTFRVPTRIELFTILDFTIQEDEHTFLNPLVFEPRANESGNTWVWSTSRVLAQKTQETYFSIDVSIGYTDAVPTTQSRGVRCVSGGPTTMPDPRLLVTPTAVVDRAARLEWDRAASAPVPWADAGGACTNKPTEGGAAWRLPTIRELQTLVDERKESAPFADDALAFDQTTKVLWSDTPVADFVEQYAWRIDLGSAKGGFDLKSASNAVRCVRSLP